MERLVLLIEVFNTLRRAPIILFSHAMSDFTLLHHNTQPIQTIPYKSSSSHSQSNICTVFETRFILNDGASIRRRRRLLSFGWQLGLLDHTASTTNEDEPDIPAPEDVDDRHEFLEVIGDALEVLFSRHSRTHN
jgi:hypothetical protein